MLDKAFKDIIVAHEKQADNDTDVYVSGEIEVFSSIDKPPKRRHQAHKTKLSHYHVDHGILCRYMRFVSRYASTPPKDFWRSFESYLHTSRPFSLDVSSVRADDFLC